MEYNTTRNKLIMPEYGRSVQNMVKHLFTIEDPKKRLEQANIIIDLMVTLNPSLKTQEDYKHKLWDHLHQIAEFKLELDGPFEKPKPDEVFAKPERLPYPQTKFENKHLGKNLGILIQKALKEEDEEKRQGFTQIIGYYMKLAYTNWHREPVHDDMIRNELSGITNGVLLYEQGGYRVYLDMRQSHKQHTGNNRNKNQNNRNYKNYKNKKHRNKNNK